MRVRKKAIVCKEYIDGHIKEKVSLKGLAQTFNWAPETIRHQFYMEYGIPISDYIRKKRLICAAEELKKREVQITQIAMEYGYLSQSSFSRAFIKEFGIKASVYQRGEEWRMLSLSRNEFERSKMRVSFQHIEQIRMVGLTEVPVDGNDTDLMEYVAYSQENRFPRLPEEDYKRVARSVYDEIGMWYHDPEVVKICFLRGPVVNDFSYVPEGAVAVTIDAGDYAVFEADMVPGDEDLAIVVKKLDHYVFKEWKQENDVIVEKLRFTFERFRDDKVSIYLPISELPVKKKRRRKTAL